MAVSTGLGGLCKGGVGILDASPQLAEAAHRLPTSMSSLLFINSRAIYVYIYIYI